MQLDHLKSVFKNFKHTDSDESAGIDGMSVKEIEEFKKENE